MGVVPVVVLGELAFELIVTAFKVVLKTIIVNVAKSFATRGFLLGFLKTGVSIGQSLEEKELQDVLGEMVLERIRNGFRDINRTVTEELTRELVDRLNKKKEESPFDPIFNNFKRFMERLKKEYPGDPEDPADQEPEVCKYFRLFESVTDSASSNIFIDFVAVTLFKRSGIEEDEINSDGELTGNKIIGDSLNSSMLIPIEDWVKLMDNPFICNELITMCEHLVKYSDPHKTIHITDESQRPMMVAMMAGYRPNISILRLKNVSGRKLVNLVGTSHDRREKNWVAFWLAKTKNCKSNNYCRIKSEKPIRNKPHTATKNIVGGHVRLYGDKSQKSFLILPICKGHNAINRWDEGKGDDRHMVATPVAVAAEITAITLPSRKRSVTTSINQLIEEAFKESNLVGLCSAEIENDFGKFINSSMNTSMDETVKWMDDTYGVTWDDFIPIWGEIKAVAQLATMKEESNNKFRCLVAEKLDKEPYSNRANKLVKEFMISNNYKIENCLNLFLKKLYIDEE